MGGLDLVVPKTRRSCNRMFLTDDGRRKFSLLFLSYTKTKSVSLSQVFGDARWNLVACSSVVVCGCVSVYSGCARWCRPACPKQTLKNTLNDVSMLLQKEATKANGETRQQSYPMS